MRDYHFTPAKILIILLLMPFFLTSDSEIEFHTGTINVTQPNMNITTIYRDDYGIPHIKAEKLVDALYALGRVHAEDRLWSMHVNRMLQAGRLSELLGSDTISMDKFIRNIGILQSAQDNIEYLDAEVKDNLQAYVDGINDYMLSLNTLPIEFTGFYTELSQVEPWTITDCILYSKFTGFSFALDWPVEILRDALFDALGEDLVMEVISVKYENMLSKSVVLTDEDAKQAGIFEEYDEDFENIISPGRQQNTNSSLLLAQLLYDILGLYRLDKGSNNWAISGNYTESGKPLLAEDPHLMNNIPSLFSQAELIYGTENIIGAVTPGLPVFSMGKTNYFSYGITVLAADTTDLYQEILSDDGKMYLFDDEWNNIIEREEVITVRGGQPISINIRQTHHGPILDHVFISQNPPLPESLYHNFSLAWTGYTKNDTSLQGTFNLLKAQSSNEIVEYMDSIIIPSMNFLYAFTNGDIGYISMGKIPIRDNPRKGSTITSGIKIKNDWLGFIPIDKQPQIVNPKKGYIITANNKFATDNTFYHPALNVFTTPRADRIEEIILDKILKGEKFNSDIMKMIQLDTVDIFARDVMPKIISLINEFKNDLIPDNLTEIDELIQLFVDWDGNITILSIQAALFTVWENIYFSKKFSLYEIDPEIKIQLLSYITTDQFLYSKIHEWNDDSDANLGEYWCQNNQTLCNPDKACILNIINSFLEAREFLIQKLGTNISNFQYGKIHNEVYQSTPYNFNLSAWRIWPSSGNRRTISVSSFNWNDKQDFTGTESPNFRMIADMSANSKSYYVLDTGVSEHVTSVHYDDQQKLLRNGEYIEMNMGITFLENYKTCLILKPLDPETH